MPYFQCPRCGGTDSFGQWEQRFNNQNVTYRDNHNRQVGTSNGGFGVSNVRQQYCRSCMSVKMDMKFTQKDFKVLGFVALLFFGIPMLISLATNIAVGVGSLSIGISLSSVQDTLARQSAIYFLTVAISLGLGISLIVMLRKFWVRKEDKKFLQDRFYKPKPPKSKKFMFSWFLVLFLGSNIAYLIYSS